MSSDKLIGPALPPRFRQEESDEDSDSDNGCKCQNTVYSAM